MRRNDALLKPRRETSRRGLRLATMMTRSGRATLGRRGPFVGPTARCAKEATSMSTHATGTIEMQTWHEQPYAEIDGAPSQARAGGSDLCHGDIEATFEYLMMYRDDGSASFVGLGRVVGRLGARPGSFVLQARRTFEGGAVRATWEVVPGSGTGDLRGLRGEGDLPSQHGQHSPIRLDYDVE